MLSEEGLEIVLVDDPDLWERFFAHVTRARAKPTFDAEERDWKLPVAGKLREALRAARERADWYSIVREEIFRSGLPFRLTAPDHRRWLDSWAEDDPDSLRATAIAFLERGAQAEERFASLVQHAEEAAAKGRLEVEPRAALAVGSLFNFAIEPDSVPMIRPGHFRTLEQIFGYEPPAAVAEAYSGHLAFARTLRSRMEESGLSVRDMIDVQALIGIATLERSFWVEEPYVAIGSSPRGAETERISSHKHYLSVCAIYRNEAPYLREWVEFHRLMGVERFFLYNNMSTDAHRDALAPYIEDGIVTLHDWDVFPPDQRDTYEHCLKEHRDDSRWIAFIDLDEFLFSPTGKPLPEVLAEYEGWPGVGVNWAVFGTSGHKTKPPGLVIENYVMRVDAPHLFIKSIVDTARVRSCVTPHHFAFDSVMTIDENHYPIHGLTSKSRSEARLRINHYVTKSEEEALTKVDRQGNWGHLERWRSSRLENRYPQRLDETITVHVPAVRRALSATAARSPDPSLSPTRSS